jgi:hypothetical protein
MKRETTTTHYQTDEPRILALFEDLLEDWGRGDGESYGSRFTEDADYVATFLLWAVADRLWRILAPGKEGA